MSPKFTPGPWGAIGRAVFSGDIFVGLASHPRDIEETPNGKFPATYDESLANARLYAAAPELHCMLLEFLEQWSGYSRLELDRRRRAGLLDGHTEDQILRARALLARIDGATP